jgi:hypothetical protein
MATSEERLRILRMIADKQITAAEGARLLEALRAPEEPHAEGQRARWLRIRVTERASGRQKMNVTVPVGLVDVGVKMGARFAPDMAGLDMDAIQAAIRSGIQGRILVAESDRDDERVELFVE